MTSRSELFAGMVRLWASCGNKLVTGNMGWAFSKSRGMNQIHQVVGGLLFT